MDFSSDISLRARQAERGASGAVTPSRAVVRLALLIALLALVAAGAGLLGQEGAPTSFTTLRGETVTLYGRGLYRLDSLMAGAGYLGQDAVVLFLGLPLLLYATYLYRRRSLRGSLLLTGTLGVFLYVYASMAFGAAYNPLFLLYTGLFSASLFAFVLAFTSIDLEALVTHIRPEIPRRGPAIFMFAGGLITLFVWGGPLLSALLNGGAPAPLDAYTTMVTSAFDLAVITPSCFITGSLLWKRRPLGLVLAFPLLVLIIMLVPMIILMTLSQLAAGVVFTIPEIVGPIAGFAILGLFAIWVLVALLRHIDENV